MIRNTAWTAVLAVIFACALPVRADYEAGQQAWDAGRSDEAVAAWQAAADAGDRRAMLALGRLFVQGLGVLQDYVEAHKWLNLAASRGEAAAAKERDVLAAKMTPQQVAAAQERGGGMATGRSGHHGRGARDRRGAGSGSRAPGSRPPAVAGDPGSAATARSTGVRAGAGRWVVE